MFGPIFFTFVVFTVSSVLYINIVIISNNKRIIKHNTVQKLRSVTTLSPTNSPTDFVVNIEGLSKSCNKMSDIQSVIRSVQSGKIPEKYTQIYNETKHNWGMPDIELKETWLSNEHSSPRLSFVVATRNDGYGGDSNARLINSIKSILMHDWNLNIEYVLVEWNVVEPSITTVLENIPKNERVNIRVIHVPFKYTFQVNLEGYNCPMFEYRAKNVGMRRANGDWILITNIDDLFPVSLSQRLDYIDEFQYNGFYTAARSDVHNAVCKSKQCTIVESDIDISYVGDFEMFSKMHLNKSGGFLEAHQDFALDSEFLFRNIKINGLTGYNILGCSYCHQHHTKTRSGV